MIIKTTNHILLEYEKKIPIIWLSDQTPCTIVISKEFAKEHGFIDIKEAVLEGRPDGLLIKNIHH